jgi:hypothetical protein
MTNDQKGPGGDEGRPGHPSHNLVGPQGFGRVLGGFGQHGVEGIDRVHAANRLRPSERVTRQQLALIHVAKRETGVSDEAYRELLQIADGVASAKDLSRDGVERVMRGFAKVGFVAKPLGPSLGDREGMASEKQLHRLRQLWFRWLGRDDDKALDRWLRKKFGISAARFATTEHAQKAIQGLIAMVGRKQRNPADQAYKE